MGLTLYPAPAAAGSHRFNSIILLSPAEGNACCGHSRSIWTSFAGRVLVVGQSILLWEVSLLRSHGICRLIMVKASLCGKKAEGKWDDSRRLGRNE